MKKKLQRCMAVLLSAALLVASLPGAAFAAEKVTTIAAETFAETDGYTPFVAGETTRVVLEENDSERFSFQAVEAGRYIISSSSSDEADPFVKVYAKEHMEDLAVVLAENDDDGKGFDFRLVLDLEAGQEIGILVHADSACTFDVRLAREATLTLDGNGGSLTNGTDTLVSTFALGESLWEILDGKPDFSLKGKNLAGWSTSPQGSLISDTTTFCPKDGQTLYAVWSEYESLVLDVPVHLSLREGNVQYFLFIPEEDGWYAIGSINNASADPYGFLYDSLKFSRWITGDDNGGSGENFEIVYELKAGKCYGISAGAFETGSYDLRITKASCIIMDGNGGATMSGETSAKAGFVTGEKLSSAIKNGRMFFREGYYLLGWSDTPDGDCIADLSKIVPVTGKTYYACWLKLNVLTVGEPFHLSLNGEEAEKLLFTPTESGTYLIYSSNPKEDADPYCKLFLSTTFEDCLEENGFDIDGRNFLLQYDMEQGVTYGILANASDADFPSYDITVAKASYATFVGNGGCTEAGKEMVTVAFPSGWDLSLVGREPEKFFLNNYSFLGWSTSPDGDLITEEKEFFPEDGATYYALWEPVQTIENGETKTIRLGLDETQRYLFTPESSGDYFFYTSNARDGLYLSGTIFSGADFQDYYSDTESKEDSSNFQLVERLQEGKTYGIEVNRTEAEDEKDASPAELQVTIAKSIRVTLHGNGGKTSAGKASVKYSVPFVKSLAETAAKPSAIFTRSGYEQVGWSATQDGASLVDADTLFPEDGQTYYAVWKKKATPTVKPTATPTPTTKPKATPTPTTKPKATPTPTTKPKATPTPTTKPKATPTPTTKPKATPTPTTKPKATPTPTTKPKATPTPKPQATPTPKPKATPTPKPKVTATPTPTPLLQVKKIQLSSTSVTLALGTTLTLKATALPANAVQRKITWKSSSSKIVTVNAKGVLTPVAIGTTKVWAITANGTKAYCTVTVKLPPVASVSLDKTSLVMKAGKRTLIKATVQPLNAENPEVTWKSTNAKVAKVTQSGIVTAVGKGSCKITATTANGTSAFCTVTVKQPQVASVVLSQKSLSMNIGTRKALTASVSPLNAQNPEVTWKSTNAKVAKVSRTGVVTAVGKGTCKITATTANGKSALCEVTVRQPVTSVTLSKTQITLKRGQAAALKVTVLPNTADNKALTWSSGNSSIATVDAAGIVIASRNKKGTVTITAIAKDGSGQGASCIVTVR